MPCASSYSHGFTAVAVIHSTARVKCITWMVNNTHTHTHTHRRVIYSSSSEKTATCGHFGFQYHDNCFCRLKVKDIISKIFIKINVCLVTTYHLSHKNHKRRRLRLLTRLLTQQTLSSTHLCVKRRTVFSSLC